MAQQQRLNPIPFGIVIGISLLLQLALIGAESRQTPVHVAENFAKAYFYLDADMQQYLCSALAGDGALVDGYLHQKKLEAGQRGLGVNYLRHKLVHSHVKIEEATITTAKIHLSGTTRVCINPVFMLVGKLFQLGDDHPVDETIELIKEKGRWRVCGNPFGLGSEI